MATIFKSIGRGIGYFFLFPVLILGIAIYAVFGLIVFIFQFFKLIFLFFTGRNLFSDLPEDIELKAKLNQDKEEVTEEVKEENNAPLSLYPSDSPVYGSQYSSPLFADKEKEELKVEEKPKIEEEPLPEDVEIEDSLKEQEGGEND